MAAIEKVFTSGAGATEYVLSRCDGNNPYALKMPDTEGCPECDGTLKENFPDSVGPARPTT